MDTIRLLVFASITTMCVFGFGHASNDDNPNGWSDPVGSVVARIKLVERRAVNGTRSIVPFLQLRNISDIGTPLKVPCGSEHVKFELVDRDGNVARVPLGLPRTGIHADPGTIVLPFDSSIEIGMNCRNWGVPKDVSAMIATDSGAWVLTNDENGSVYLRATLRAAEQRNNTSMWHGALQIPQIKVKW